MQINADLHCHSTMSDGWLAPADVVRRAVANGVNLLALTDHDEIGGLDEALEEASRLGLHLLPGVEISVTFLNETVHVVGLGIDHHDPELLGGLETVRSGRIQRARKIGAALDAVGIHGAFEGACRLAHNPAMVGRAHFARYMVSTGLMPNVSTVFQYYLARGKPGYVEHEWASLDEATRWIHGAGGVAVLAHPARYRFSSEDLHRLLDRFVACGGEGIEVVAGAHSATEVLKFAAIARRWRLLASRASDFHGEAESSIDLGHSSHLPPDLTPVWERFVRG